MNAKASRFFTERSWIEGAAVDQLERLAAQPGISAVAGMPDLHPGKYGPVGTGMLAEDIHPAIVGSDIGCGMGLFKLDGSLRKFKPAKVADRLRELDRPWDGDVAAARDGADLGATGFDASLGSIGGGNHFCELQAIEEIVEPEAAAEAGLDPDLVHVLVHSGSRGLGYAILQGLLAAGVDRLDPEAPDGARYLIDHDRAVRWARLNRAIVAGRAAAAARCDLAPVADLAHTHLEVTPAGILHRKGAAPADRGLVPIPGSRETLSYLVQPLPGAPAEALACLAHGAGRKYDRKAMHGRIEKVRSARERLTRNPFGGIVVCEDRDLLVEEAGDAYKNIDRVIEDLVAFRLARVVATFRPLVTFKTGVAHSAPRDRRAEDQR